MSRDGPPRRDSSDATAARLLRAASELVGGDESLARRLNMSAVLLRKYMAGRDELPPHIVLRVVDLLLEERESQYSMPMDAGAATSGGSDASGPPN